LIIYEVSSTAVSTLSYTKVFNKNANRGSLFLMSLCIIRFKKCGILLRLYIRLNYDNTGSYFLSYYRYDMLLSDEKVLRNALNTYSILGIFIYYKICPFVFSIYIVSFKIR